MAVTVGCVQHLGCPTAASTFQPVLQAGCAGFVACPRGDPS